MFGCQDGGVISKEELKTRYLKLAKELHPDASLRGPEDAQHAGFQELQHCYQLLLSEHSKKNEPEWLRKLREDYATSKDPFP